MSGYLIIFLSAGAGAFVGTVPAVVLFYRALRRLDRRKRELEAIAARLPLGRMPHPSAGFGAASAEELRAGLRSRGTGWWGHS